jgi:hypothetical protein
MRRLYAAENCRRLGSAATSGSGVLPTVTFIASTSNNGCISWFMVSPFYSKLNWPRHCTIRSGVA